MFFFRIKLETYIMSWSCLYWGYLFSKIRKKPFSIIQIVNYDYSSSICLFRPSQIPLLRWYSHTTYSLSACLTVYKLLMFILCVIVYYIMTSWINNSIRVSVLKYIIFKVASITKYIFHLHYFFPRIRCHFIKSYNI